MPLETIRHESLKTPGFQSFSLIDHSIPADRPHAGIWLLQGMIEK